jgi:phytoene dehydrogenase-like protein
MYACHAKDQDRRSGRQQPARIHQPQTRPGNRLAREQLAFHFVALDDLHLYNQDLAGEMPKSVVHFRAEIAAADALLFVTPERVRQVLVENGRAIGVETDKGETIRAAAVAAGINPKLLYLNLVDARALPEGFRRRMETGVAGLARFG